MKSSLYFGEVTHERTAPKKHFFRYRLFMVHLFLDELSEVFKGRLLWSANRRNLAWFNRDDYHGNSKEPLEDAVRRTVHEQLGHLPEGRISVLTHMRYFGHCFNPVSFYYCWDAETFLPEALLVEITNTPWNERYARAFEWQRKPKGTSSSEHNFRKEFHVSPFIGMKVDYAWRFSLPGERLAVEMTDSENRQVFFRAGLDLHRKPISTGNLAWALARFPLITLRVLWGIYWNAFLLRTKGCAFHPHPKHLSATSE